MAQAVGDPETDDERNHDREGAGDQTVVVEGAVPGTAHADSWLGAGWGLGQENHLASASWATAIPPTTSQTCERPISNPMPNPSPVRTSNRTRLTAVKPTPSASERWTSRPFALPTGRPIASARPFVTSPVANPKAITATAATPEAASVLRSSRLFTGTA